ERGRLWDVASAPSGPVARVDPPHPGQAVGSEVSYGQIIECHAPENRWSSVNETVVPRARRPLFCQAQASKFPGVLKHEPASCLLGQNIGSSITTSSSGVAENAPPGRLPWIRAASTRRRRQE